MTEASNNPEVLPPSLEDLRAAVRGTAGSAVLHHSEGSARSGQSFAILGTVSDRETSGEELEEADVYRESERCALCHPCQLRS